MRETGKELRGGIDGKWTEVECGLFTGIITFYWRNAI
jgi:hypothetical protein